MKNYKPYDAYKDSGVEWLGKIPEGWGVISINRAAKKIQTGSTPPTKERKYYEDGEIPWYGPSSIGDNLTIGEPQKRISKIAILDGVLRMFPPNTCLIVTIGAVGRVGQLRNYGSTNQQITAIEFNEKINNHRYCSYAIKSLEPILVAISTNSMIPMISQTTIGELKIPYPPKSEQHAIAYHIDHKTNIIDELIEKTKLSIEKLKERRSSFITSAVTGKICIKN